MTAGQEERSGEDRAKDGGAGTDAIVREDAEGPSSGESVSNGVSKGTLREAEAQWGLLVIWGQG